MDNNVDPTSPFQVVNAPIQANKKHDLLFVPGGGHTAGGGLPAAAARGFFVHRLLGCESSGLQGGGEDVVGLKARFR